MFQRKRHKKSYITVLDIGTSKICGFMAHIIADNKFEIAGVGYAASKGIKGGAVINLDKATECIGAVLSQIEQQANRPVESVTISLSSGQLKSRHAVLATDIPDEHPISSADVKNLVDNIISSLVPAEEEVIHAFPLAYMVDQEQNVPDPRGLYAKKLQARVHVVTIQETQLRNLLTVLDRCHVVVDKKVATPYASALAVLTEEEKEMGATVLDMGGGTTSYAQFLNGGLVNLGLIPLGGNKITHDIAQILCTSRITAERLKTLNGAAFLSPRDDLERLIVPIISEEAENNEQIPRAELIKIIVPCVENILEQVHEKLSEHEAFLLAARRIVLCGGGSCLQGIKEKIESLLDGNVRLFKSNQIKNLPNQLDSYTFITCIGLMKYVLASAGTSEHFETQPQQKTRLRKVLQWLFK